MEPVEGSEELLRALAAQSNASNEVGPACERYHACCISFADSLDEGDGVDESHLELAHKTCALSMNKGEQWCQDALEGMSLASTRFGASARMSWPEECMVNGG
jgi:hypothetical protein